MQFFGGVLVGILIGLTIMCVLAVIPDDEDKIEIDIEEEKEEKK